VDREIVIIGIIIIIIIIQSLPANAWKTDPPCRDIRGGRSGSGSPSSLVVRSVSCVATSPYPAFLDFQADWQGFGDT